LEAALAVADGSLDPEALKQLQLDAAAKAERDKQDKLAKAERERLDMEAKSKRERE
jgi:hypothetical protein